MEQFSGDGDLGFGSGVTWRRGQPVAGNHRNGGRKILGSREYN